MTQESMLVLRAAYENQLAAERAGEALYIIGRLTQMLSDFGLDELSFDEEPVGLYLSSELMKIRDERQTAWLDALHEVRLQRASLWDMISRRERSLAPGKLEAVRDAALAEWRYEMAELYLINYEGEYACQRPIPTRQFVWEVESELPTAYLP